MVNIVSLINELNVMDEPAERRPAPVHGPPLWETLVLTTVTEWYHQGGRNKLSSIFEIQWRLVLDNFYN